MTLTLEKKRQELQGFHGCKKKWIPQFLILIAAFLLIYTSVIIHLVSDWWNDPDYSHGFLIPILSVYFLSERWKTFTQTPAKPGRLGLLVVVLGLLLLLLGEIGAELFSLRFSMLVLIAGLVWYHLGRKHLQIIAFPLAFLIFMIPLPSILLNTITFPLQLIAAKLSTVSLQVIDFPVYREGNIIFLPHATLEVAEACSGLRSLMSLLALAVVFAYVTQRQWWKMALLVFSAVPIAIIANAFRIWGTGVLAHLYGMQVADGFYHSFAGWLVFIVAFVLLSIEGLMLSQFGKATSTATRKR